MVFPLNKYAFTTPRNAFLRRSKQNKAIVMQEKDFFDSDDIFPVMLHSIYAERINFRSCARHEIVLEKYGKHRKERSKSS